MTASTTLERAGSALPEARAAQASHSRFVQRIRRRYATDLTQLPEGLPNREAMQQAVERLRSSGRDLASAMRVTRQLVLERMAVLDIEQAASLDDVTHTMTILAEVTLEAALAQARLDCDARFGPPRDAAGQDIEFWIVGMGKLGARELNVSSDIDLNYVY
jgi:glutamate-ammonia-ligase adenylyltransferase